MSKFLGKIHYWLFNKIKWFESIEKDIIDYCRGNNLPVDIWNSKVWDKYGKPTEDRPLEELIDTSDIHGWLQDKIEKAESRQAEYITEILKSSNSYEKDLIDIFYNRGKEDGKFSRTQRSAASPEEVFSAINDYILDGMPCDRVNEFLENTEDVFTWRATRCLHAIYWNNAGGEVGKFYLLRGKWIEAFVETFTKEFKYTKNDDGSESIRGK
nr:hypothetical protein [Clostridium polynesiense]